VRMYSDTQVDMFILVSYFKELIKGSGVDTWVYDLPDIRGEGALYHFELLIGEILFEQMSVAVYNSSSNAGVVGNRGHNRQTGMREWEIDQKLRGNTKATDLLLVDFE
jgi:hypothetical protein